MSKSKEKSGSKVVTAKTSDIVTYSEAKRMVKRLGYKSHQAYSWAKIEGRLPSGLPKRPQEAYKKAWKGWAAFLGTSNPVSVGGVAAR